MSYLILSSIRKILSLLLVFGFVFSHQLIAQDFYFTPRVRYHTSLSSQNAPGYFGFTEEQNRRITDFSLSAGTKYGIAIGYRLNDIFNVELGYDYFESSEEVVNIGKFSGEGIRSSPSLGIPIDGYTVREPEARWQFISSNFAPTITMSKTLGRSAFTAKAGVIVGIGQLKYTIPDGFSWDDWILSKELCFGYTMGFEYSLRIISGLSLIAECGVENSSYTPNEAIISKVGEYSIPVEERTVYSKQKIYKSKISNYPVDSNQPEARIKDTMHFSSLYLGVGIKFSLY